MDSFLKGSESGQTPVFQENLTKSIDISTMKNEDIVSELEAFGVKVKNKSKVTKADKLLLQNIYSYLRTGILPEGF